MNPPVKDLVRAAELKVVDLTAPLELFHSEAFLQLRAEAVARLDEALVYLSSPEPSDQQKTITIYAMQALPLTHLIRFCEGCLSMLEGRRISPRLFDTAILPGYEMSTTFAERYTDQAVKALMTKILASPAVSANLKKWITGELMTGRALSYIEDRRLFGPLPAATP